jgi:hypothetical protein
MVDRSESWAKTSVRPGRWQTSARFQICFQINLTGVERQNTVQERSVCEPAAESISAEVSSADIAGLAADEDAAERRGAQGQEWDNRRPGEMSTF